MEERLDIYKEFITKLNPDLSILIEPIFYDLVHLEKQLALLRKQKMFVVHEKDPNKQKILPASKQYRETLSLYRDTFKLILSLLKENDDDSEDPVKEFIELWKQKNEVDNT